MLPLYIDSIRARDSTRYPLSRKILPPLWNAFSMTIPTPTISAPDWFTTSISAFAASPFAKKSSMISTLSSLDKSLRATAIVFVSYLVNENTCDV